MRSSLKAFLLNQIDAGPAPGRLARRYVADPDFPALVSFPRTGSHWLRILLELYTDRPLLVRSFFDHTNTDFLLYHTHDLNLTERRRHVIYLYRSPVEVIYSQVRYHREDYTDKRPVLFWSAQYACHLLYWIFLERFTTRKILVTYEEMRTEPALAFRKILEHTNVQWDAESWKKTWTEATREKVGQQTAHDRRVINTDPEYEQQRQAFRIQHRGRIEETMSRLFTLAMGDAAAFYQLFPSGG